MTKEKLSNHRIEVARLGSGWAAIHTVDVTDEKGTYRDVQQTGIGRYLTEAEATMEASMWSKSDEIPLYTPGAEPEAAPTPAADEPETTVLYSAKTPENGVILLAKWPEGYVLRHHGKIVWRSWEEPATPSGQMTAEHIDDLIDDASPGSLKPDVRYRIACRLRDALNPAPELLTPLTGRGIPPALQRELSAIVEKFSKYVPSIAGHGERDIKLTVTFTDGKPSIKGILIT